MKQWTVSSERPQTGQGARFWVSGPEPPPTLVADASEVERLREALAQIRDWGPAPHPVAETYREIARAALSPADSRN